MKYTFYRCFTRLRSVHRSPKMYMPKDIYNGLQPSWVKMGITMRCLARCVEGPATEPTFICPAPACVPERTAHIEDTN